MKTLVVGGTGTVGSEVVRKLLERKADVRVMTSTQEKVNKLPADVEGVVGNLRDGGSLQNVLRGVDRLFLLTPLSETETEEGLNAVNTARTAGIARIVYMSVHRAEDILMRPISQRRFRLRMVSSNQGFRTQCYARTISFRTTSG